MSFQSQTINLSKLRFDPQNPRLLTEVKAGDDIDIINHMLREEGLIELMASIGELGYSGAEPLLVTPDTSSSGFYIVVEGNRRLAALRLLNDPDLAKIRKPSVSEIVENARNKNIFEIPCIISPSRSAVLDYLGFRHITGVKEWSPLAKAKYLKQLYDNNIAKEPGNTRKAIKTLADTIGSNSSYVRRLLTGLTISLYANDNAFWGLDLEEKDIEFSVLTTALSYKNIVAYLAIESDEDFELLNINNDNCKNLFDWVFIKNKDGRSRIGESRNLKTLNSIMAVPTALEAFTGGMSLKDASLLTSEPTDSFIALLTDATEKLEMAHDYLKNINEPAEKTSYIVDAVFNNAQAIKALFKAKLDEVKSTKAGT